MFIWVWSSVPSSVSMILAAGWSHCLWDLSWPISKFLCLFPLTILYNSAVSFILMWMGFNPVIHSASYDTVLYAFAIFRFISLCNLVNLFLWLVFSKIFSQTGAPYRRSGCIPPCIVFLKLYVLVPGLVSLTSIGQILFSYILCHVCNVFSER